MPPFVIDGKQLFEEMVRLANENDHSWRFTKKGDTRPLADVEAGKAARRAAIKAKQDAAAGRMEQARADKRASRGPSLAERMLRAMEPGEWYGMGDLQRMAGADRTARGKVHQVLMRKGWVEGAHNPAWSDRQLNPWEIMGGAEPQPKRLYRLTEIGEGLRAKLAGVTVPECGKSSDGTS